MKTRRTPWWQYVIGAGLGPPSIEIPTSLSYAVGSARKSHWYNFSGLRL